MTSVDEEIWTHVLAANCPSIAKPEGRLRFSSAFADLVSATAPEIVSFIRLVGELTFYYVDIHSWWRMRTS